MSDFFSSFNANNVEPAQPFAPIPEGVYPAIIVSSVVKPTKNKTGEYLALELQIPSMKNRKAWVNITMRNPNAQAVEIGHAEMAALCRAVGNMAPKNAAVFCNKKVQLTVKLRKNDKGEMENVCKIYAPKEKEAAKVEKAAQPVAETSAGEDPFNQ
jgi:hypothetical protein